MIDKKPLLPIMALSASLVACGERPGEDPTITANQAADLIFTNAAIYTMDADRSSAQSIAIKEGRIVYVGDNAGADAWLGTNTQSTDLAGRMMLPAFQDVHLHPALGGIAYGECALFDTTSVNDVVAAVQACVDANPGTDLVRGAGWNWSIFGEGEEPDKAVLDAISYTRPIVIADGDGHSLWLNSVALEEIGVDANTPSPDGGEIVKDPASGELTGLLLEGPAMAIAETHYPFTADDYVAGLEYAQDYLHSLGITAIQDAIVRIPATSDYDDLAPFKTLIERNDLRLRVSAAIYWQPGQGLAQIDAIKAAREESQEPLLRVSTVKFWADGILEAHTAKLLKPYLDKPETDGLLMVPLDELLEGSVALDAEGFQLHIHTIGDATVRYALDAVEAARKSNGPRDARHLTAHTQLVADEDIERFAELGLIAGFSPYWAYNEDYVLRINPPQLGAERMKQMYPVGRLIESGARIAFGSDWSVSSADPLLGIEAAVTRLSPHGEDVPIFNPIDKISLDAAIAGYTIDAAFANFLEHETGSIEVGKYADLIVIDRDLFAIPPADISEAKVTATLFAGELVFGALENTQ